MLTRDLGAFVGTMRLTQQPDPAPEDSHPETFRISENADGPDDSARSRSVAERSFKQLSEAAAIVGNSAVVRGGAGGLTVMRSVRRPT